MLHRRGRRTRGAGILIAALGLAAGGCDQPTPAAPEALSLSDLDLARRSTTRYLDVSVAVQQGFVADAFCVASPAGAMGFHYVNTARIDARLTPGEPEVLLYIHEGARVRLVGIEYMIPVFENGRPYFGLNPPANPGPTPEMFGQAFQGPMPGHNPAMPWHYDLHVWIWEDNPAGTFAQFNPSLTCS
jgi:hypothetical protein